MKYQPQPTIAAAVRRDNGGVDDLVAGFALSLIDRGWWVRGLVQEMHDGIHGGVFSLVDLDNGKSYPITQNLGKFSSACRLDPAGIAAASGVMQRIADEGADLAIFNRFSGLEAEGGGFSAEMLSIMSLEIPTLTIVPERHLTVWRRFTGGLATELEDSRNALENWFFDTSLHPSAMSISAPVFTPTPTTNPGRNHGDYCNSKPGCDHF